MASSRRERRPAESAAGVGVSNSTIYRPKMHLKTVPASGSDEALRGQTAEERELAGLIVSALNLETAPGEIDPEAPLYGEGLGLDSIDILEMSLAISKTYGVQLRSDDPDNGKIYRSLRSLNAYVQSRRAK